jgi:hypothetical protein
MRRAVKVLLLISAVLSIGIHGLAQQQRAAANDPRIGLKPGWQDAGVAIRHMEHVANLPKPTGFFDPLAPAGSVSPPEPPPPPPGAPPEPPRTPPAPGTPPPPGSGFTNSDIAFSGQHVVVGNYHGFNFFDIENARKPRLMASVVCPGGQGDVSIHGNLLFMSVEQTRGRLDCGTQGVVDVASKERFRGVRIFDISDLKNPKQLAAVQTCRGSHTHTLVTTTTDQRNIYIYGSGTGQVRPGEELTECSGGKPEENPETALFSIDVIQVPLANPAEAKVIARPRVFADAATGSIAGLWRGGNHGEGTQRTSETNQCHDITVYPELGLAAGACSGNGILFDISDPVNPKRLDVVTDKGFAYWHSATFNNDGTKVIFTDEWGGGGRPRCRATDPMDWGGDAIFDIVDQKLVARGHYKMPAPQTEFENCVAHNGALIPVPGRDIMVQSWYQGGLSVFDFTDSSNPVEIAFFDRGPINGTQMVSGGYWSAAWYNGFIYGTEISRGLDIFRLLPSEFLTQNEIDAAVQIRSTEFNAQQQPRVTWPATVVVARAYLDQLNRSKAVTSARAGEIKSTLDRLDKTKPGSDSRNTLDSIQNFASSLDADAAKASGRNKQRIELLSGTIKGRVAALR